MLGRLFPPVEDAELNWVLMLVTVLVGISILAALHRFPPQARGRVTVAVTFLGGLFYVLEFFIPKENFLSPYLPSVGDMVQVLFAFTIGLGLINICLVHAKAIAQRREGWGNSVAFYVAAIAMLVAAFWNHYTELAQQGKPPPKTVPFEAAFFEVMFGGMFVPLNATMFSVLAFFITSAAYRAFRVRTVEAGLLMAAAFIIMLGQVPVGMALTGWLPETGWLHYLRVEEIAGWLMNTINSAAYRGMIFGIAVGGLAMSLRIWLSLERGAFFEQRG